MKKAKIAGAFIAMLLAASNASLAATVPSVGCPAEGQTGPIAAPAGGAKAVSLSEKYTSAFAFYFARDNNIGVLAPRGWRCLELYGSNGWMLFVAPGRIDPDAFFHEHWKGIPGPGVTVMERSGETSGRFDVAQIAARVFPKARKFVDRVIAEKIEPESDFPDMPYAADTLRYHGDRFVWFETAPLKKGLGTETWLMPNDSSIAGFAQLTDDDSPSALLVSVRLPAAQQNLQQAILDQAATELSQ